MIEESKIVKETRKARSDISKNFSNNPDDYINYLIDQQTKNIKKLSETDDKVSQYDNAQKTVG